MHLAKPKREIVGLTSLRFFAAFYVLLFHAFRLTLNKPALFHGFLESGGTAVTFFFVLSGFVLAFVHSRTADALEPISVKDFWRARFARIYPLYFVGFLLAAPYTIHHFLESNTRFAACGKTVVQGATTVLLMQAWIPRMTLTWNMPGWSLSVEAFFYFLFPILALGIWRIPRRAIVPLLLALYGASLALTSAFSGFAMHPPLPEHWDVFVKFNPVLRLPEFAFGIALARIYLSAQSETPGKWSALLFGFLIFGLLFASELLPYYPLHNGLLIPVFAFLIFAVAAENDWGLRWLIRNRAIAFLGRASFALYILQFPIQQAVVSFFRQTMPASDLRNSLIVALAIILPIPVSIFAHLWIEIPAQRWLKQRFEFSSSQSEVPAVIRA